MIVVEMKLKIGRKRSGARFFATVQPGTMILTGYDCNLMMYTSLYSDKDLHSGMETE